MPRTATTAQIRAAYVARARLAHPDLVGRKGLDVMRGLNEAWDVLKDAAKRQAWDAEHFDPASARASGPVFDDEVNGRPFWTGAMGPPPGRPWGPVLEFGIYEGWSLGEISRTDRGYLIWLRDRQEARAIQGEIAKLLDPSTEEPSEARPQKRRWYPNR